MPRIFFELARFSAVGALAYVVDVAVFNLLRFTVVGEFFGIADLPLLAKTISVAVAVIVSWVGNRHWTYRHQRGRDTGPELVLFIGANVLGMGAALACLWVSHYALGFTSALADNISANIIGLGVGTLIRWWLYRKYVFTSVPGGGLSTGDDDAQDTPQQVNQ